MIPRFTNNLRKGDRVMDVRDRRLATVALQPRENSAKVGLTYQGNSDTSKTYQWIGHLRLIVDGKPEDVPPCEGTPPPEDDGPTLNEIARGKESPAVAAVRDALTKNRELMEIHNRQYKELQTENERLEEALKVLTKS